MEKEENSLHYETIDIRPSTWRTKLFVSLSHRVPRGALTIFFFFFFTFFSSRAMDFADEKGLLVGSEICQPGKNYR